jgi:hypothetical protein
VRKFKPREFENFFRCVDAELDRACTIVLVDGGAIALAYHSSHATADLDIWKTSEEVFWDAVRRANAKVRDPVPVQKAAVAGPPYNFEDRLRLVNLPKLRRLKVMVPEAHDLVLLKTARAEAHDLDAIEDIHREQPLSLSTLIERYEETKGQVMGPPNRFKLNFLAVVARLFGEKIARELDQNLKT